MSDKEYDELYSSEEKNDNFFEIAAKVAKKIKVMKQTKRKPLFIKQNNLPEDKIMYWLATMTTPFRSNEVELDKSIKEDVISKILSKKYTFGHIQPSIILPYLKFSDKLAFFINSLEIPTHVYSSGYNNIAYLYKLIEKAYFEQSGFQRSIRDFFKSKLTATALPKDQYSSGLNITFIECDDFPVISLGISSATIVLDSYGIKNPFLFETVTSVYSLTKHEYINFYSSISPYISNFVKLVYTHKLVSKVQYNEGQTKKGNYTDILNAPELLQAIFPNNLDWIKQMQLLNTPPIEEEMRNYGKGAEGRIIKYLATINFFPFLLKFITRTDIPLEDITELDDIDLPEEITTLSYPRFNDTLTEILTDIGINEPLSRPEDIHIYIKEHAYISPEEIVRLYFISLNINPSVTNNISSLESNIVFMKIISLIQDYGFPGIEEKDKNPYLDRSLIYISKLLNSNTSGIESIYDSLANLLDIENKLLTKTVFMTILKRGFINPLPIEERLLDRYKMWKYLSEDQKDIMRIMYNDPHLNIVDFMNKNDTLIYCEDIVSRYESSSLQKLIVELGMVVPHNYSSFEYFIKSLPLYAEIASRGEDWDIEAHLDVSSLYLMCDIEIVEFILTGYTGHTSRAELLAHATRYLNNGEMIVLIKWNEEVDIINEDELNEPTSREEIFKYMSRAPSNSPFNLRLRYYESGVSTSSMVEFTVSELNMCNQDLISQGSNDIDTRTEEQKLLDAETPLADTLRTFQPSVYTGRDILINRVTQPEIKPLSSEGIVILDSVLTVARSYFNDLVVYYLEKGTLKGINGSFETKEDKDIMEDCNAKVVSETNDILNALQDRLIAFTLKNGINYKLEKQTAELFLSLSYPPKIVNLSTRSITVNAKQLIIEGLIIAFDCGMIQRQWKGVRGEYPYRSNEAGNEQDFEIKKDILVGDQLLLLGSVFEALDRDFPKAGELFKSLSLKNLVTGAQTEEFITESMISRIPIPDQPGQFHEDLKDKTLRILYDDIAKGERAGGLCIRLGSSKFIWTAYYWLKLFGNLQVLGKFEVLEMRHFG
jgi:hypothetical protein